MATSDSFEPGTVIIVHRHSVGGQRRAGEILEVIGDRAHRRYRVRWDDGHESIFFPSDDVAIERYGSHAGRAPRAAPRAS